MLRYIKNNKVEVWFYIFLLLFLAQLSRWGYNYFQIFKLKEEKNAIKKEFSLKENKLEKLSSNKKYKKYEVVKFLQKEYDGFSWNEAFESLISIFDTLKNLWEKSNSLVLNDFKVDMEKVDIKGKVIDLENMYKNSGIIDKISSLDFIESFSIPSYEKEGRFYKFNLDAKISTNVK